MTFPSYKLTYFNCRGRAEPARFVFAFAGVPYEDVRLEYATWTKEEAQKFPWGLLPVLEVDGKVLAQSGAIVRYLGKLYKVAGDDDFEAAKCDEMVGAHQDLAEIVWPVIIELDETKKKEGTAKILEETFPKYFDKFNEILENNGGFLVGKRLSYADFYIAHNFQFYNEMYGKDGNLFIKYPAIQTHQNLVLNTPGIKEWIEKRAVTMY